jgi:hypothetical protein
MQLTPVKLAILLVASALTACVANAGRPDACPTGAAARIFKKEGTASSEAIKMCVPAKAAVSDFYPSRGSLRAEVSIAMPSGAELVVLLGAPEGVSALTAVGIRDWVRRNEIAGLLFSDPPLANDAWITRDGVRAGYYISSSVEGEFRDYGAFVVRDSVVVFDLAGEGAGAATDRDLLLDVALGIEVNPNN